MVVSTLAVGKSLYRVVLWLAIVMPIALGPATVTRFLGGEPTHHCLCGMKRGTCACLECRDLERSYSTTAVRTSCDDDDGFARAPSLPNVIPNGERLVIVPARAQVREAQPMILLDSQLLSAPPTPPPRG
jgi:hypothetical protein